MTVQSDWHASLILSAIFQPFNKLLLGQQFPALKNL